MKSFKTAVLLFFIFNCSASLGSEYVKITIYGGQGDCSSWIKKDQDDFEKNLNDGFNSAWIAGYMSGTNMSDSKDTFKDISVPTASDFVSQYCSEHPSKGASDAMNELINKLSSLR